MSDPRPPPLSLPPLTAPHGTKTLLLTPSRFIYLLLLGYAIHSMIPTADEKEAMRSGKAVRSRKAGEGYGDDDDDASLSESGERHPAVMTSTNDKVVFEMIPPSRQHILQQNQSQPQPPPSLFTPRTQAFHSLERKLPLRGE